MSPMAPRPARNRHHDAGAGLLIACTLLLLATAPPLAAQEPAPSEAVQAQEATTPSGPAAIPATAILARGEETDAMLLRVAQVMQPDPEIEALAVTLQGEREILDGYRSELDRIE